MIRVKLFSCLVGALISSTFAEAETSSAVPDCWNRSLAMPKEYLILLDREKLTAEQTLQALAEIEFPRYFNLPSDYPRFMDSVIIVHLKALDEDWDENGNPLKDEHLRQLAEQELLKLVQRYAVEIECNSIYDAPDFVVVPHQPDPLSRALGPKH